MTDYTPDKIGLLLDQSIRSEHIEHSIEEYEYLISEEEVLSLRNRWQLFFKQYDIDRKNGVLFQYYKI